MISTFDLTIYYAQIMVYLPTVDRPGLLWTKEHTAQGFAWHPGIVSFGISSADRDCLIQVDVASKITVSSESLWAICVPFEVSSSPVQIGSVFDTHEVDIPMGKYGLVFEVFPGGSAVYENLDGEQVPYGHVVSIRFCSDGDHDFRILKMGGELTTDKILRRDAKQA